MKIRGVEIWDRYGDQGDEPSKMHYDHYWKLIVMLQ